MACGETPRLKTQRLKTFILISIKPLNAALLWLASYKPYLEGKPYRSREYRSARSFPK